MKNLGFCLLFWLLLPGGIVIAQQKSTLYREKAEIKDTSCGDLKMDFEEIERQEKTSLIKVTHTSGASVPSILFVVKGCYQIAKLRQAKYFILLKEWKDPDGNWMYRIGFTATQKVNAQRYFGKDFDPNQELHFLSVKDFEVLWENKH